MSGIRVHTSRMLTGLPVAQGVPTGNRPACWCWGDVIFAPTHYWTQVASTRLSRRLPNPYTVYRLLPT